MRQYTNESQTAKLIELGFEKPKSISGYYTKPTYEYDAKTNSKIVVYDDTQYPMYAYSIGELIEILPTHCNFWDVVDVKAWQRQWNVGYIYAPSIIRTELVDALFDMIVKLKEEGVI